MDFSLSTYLNLILLLDRKRPGYLPQFNEQKEEKFVKYLDSFGDLFKKTWIKSPYFPEKKGSLLVHTQPLPFNPNDGRRKNRQRDFGILLGYPEKCVDDHVRVYSGNRKNTYINYLYILRVDEWMLYCFTCTDGKLDMSETVKGYEESLKMKVTLDVEMKDYSIVLNDFNGKTIDPIPELEKSAQIIVNGKRYRRRELKDSLLYLYER